MPARDSSLFFQNPRQSMHRFQWVLFVVLLILIKCLPLDNSCSSFQTQKTIKNDALSYDLSAHELNYNSCINDTVVPRNWCLDSNSVPRYVGKEEWPPKVIYHYSHTGYDKCLANKTVVLIGDSRVRYQFMHLASFLNRKEYMKCEDYNTFTSNATSPSKECYLIEHEHRSFLSTSNLWTSWYKQSTDMISSNRSDREETSQQKALCDCYRPSPFVPELTYENRFLVRSTPHHLEASV
mmetsp:Transcript_7090/g.19810  ORF Transcript_7090/g.19810 Transcript_7090/m.19810 type:complete len:238 (+) Transcript_7090:32-745(+)